MKLSLFTDDTILCIERILKIPPKNYENKSFEAFYEELVTWAYLAKQPIMATRYRDPRNVARWALPVLIFVHC